MATYDTSYYDNAYKEFEEKQLKRAGEQKAQTEADYNSRLKQAYINNRQTEKATNDALTQAGIRGGMTETTMLKNATNYQNTRNTLGSEKTKAIQEINTNADNNILNFKMTNDAAKNAYIEGREAEDRATAQAEKDKQDQANINLWTSKYGGYTDVTELQNTLANTIDPNEKAIIQARINYLNEEASTKAATENTAFLESKYGGITNLTTLKTALKNAKTTEEKTIIQNQINKVTENNNVAKYDQYSARFSKYYSIDKLNEKLKTATDPIMIQVINERIGYLKAKKKGY